MCSESSSETSWRTALGFADRLAIVNKIAASLEQTEPVLKRPEAIRQAQSIESECLNKAFHQDDYNRLWTQRLNELISQSHKNPALRNDDDPFSHLTVNTPPTKLGCYTSCIPFASGLFSTIYKSPPASTTPPGPTTTVALKVTNPTTMAAPHNSKKEARILRSLSGTPHILPLLESFTIPPSVFVLVTPYLPFTLSYLLETSAPIKVPNILYDIFTGLQALHSQSIIHRDIKPSNILFSSPNAPAYIADFGIAWDPKDPTSEPPTEKITDVGTTCYRAPEILFGYRGYGVALDLWATGCVLAECLHPMHEPFFDAGDLGSELRLVSSIFEKLGTPTRERWPETSQLPDFGKITFFDFPCKPWSELTPYATEKARDLVSKLLVYESRDRIGATEALEHPFFAGCSQQTVK